MFFILFFCRVAMSTHFDSCPDPYLFFQRWQNHIHSASKHTFIFCANKVIVIARDGLDVLIYNCVRVFSFPSPDWFLTSLVVFHLAPFGQVVQNV